MFVNGNVCAIIQNSYIYIVQWFCLRNMRNMLAVRYAMCIVAQRDNAMHDFVDDDTLE